MARVAGSSAYVPKAANRPLGGHTWEDIRGSSKLKALGELSLAIRFSIY